METLYGKNYGEADCCCNEIQDHDYGKTFSNILANEIIKSLDLKYGIERTIIINMITKVINDICNNRDGLLTQYLHSQLDLMLPRFIDELDLPEDTKINYNYASHAKFADVIDAIIKKFDQLITKPDECGIGDINVKCT